MKKIDITPGYKKLRIWNIHISVKSEALEMLLDAFYGFELLVFTTLVNFRIVAILANYEQKSIFKVSEYVLKCFFANTRNKLTISCLEGKRILE